MNDICVPLPRIESAKTADVQVKIANGVMHNYNYRVESFEWAPEPESGDRRIEKLKNHIQNYDRNWELIQIYNPGPKDRFIHVLFRARQILAN
jgi:hypothetical protein